MLGVQGMKTTWMPRHRPFRPHHALTTPQPAHLLSEEGLEAVIAGLQARNAHRRQEDHRRWGETAVCQHCDDLATLPLD